MKAIIVHVKYRAPYTRENKKQTKRFTGPSKWDDYKNWIDRLLISCGKVKLTVETE